MIYSYARVRTTGQVHDGNSLETQVNALQEAGAEKIFSDVFSGRTTKRPELDKLLRIIQADDTFIINKAGSHCSQSHSGRSVIGKFE